MGEKRLTSKEAWWLRAMVRHFGSKLPYVREPKRDSAIKTLRGKGCIRHVVASVTCPEHWAVTELGTASLAAHPWCAKCDRRRADMIGADRVPRCSRCAEDAAKGDGR